MADQIFDPNKKYQTWRFIPPPAVHMYMGNDAHLHFYFEKSEESIDRLVQWAKDNLIRFEHYKKSMKEQEEHVAAEEAKKNRGREIVANPQAAIRRISGEKVYHYQDGSIYPGTPGKDLKVLDTFVSASGETIENVVVVPSYVAPVEPTEPESTTTKEEPKKTPVFNVGDKVTINGTSFTYTDDGLKPDNGN